MTEEKKLTGYPSMDKPWLKYYDKIFDEKDLPHKTIFQLAYERNKDNLSNIAIDFRTSENNFDAGTTITYKEFFDYVQKCAKSLKALGINKDEIVPIILPNIPEARFLIYANSILGATTYPISPFLSVNQLNRIVTSNNIKNIVIFEPFYKKYKSILSAASLENIIVIASSNKIDKLYKNLLTWDDFIALGKHKENVEAVEYSKEHIAAIIGTSGTTGVSKGVCLSDDNMNAAALAYLECFEGSCLDILIPSIGYGLTMLHYQTMSGEKVYLIPELVTDKIAELICKIKPDMFPGGPVHYINLAQSKEFLDGTLPKIKNTLCGGATLPKEVEEKLNDVTIGYEETEINDNILVRQGFALSESIATGTYSKRGAYTFGSVGIPIPYETISIFEPDTDKELTYGEKGEICISSPMVMQYYLNNPDETDNVIRIHKDGKRWIHTKDIGYMDESGHLFHVERIKNIFMRTGFNVHPSAISKFLNTLPLVKNSYVMGFEHPTEQCVPIAFVIIDEKCNKDISEFEEYLKRECYKNLEETSVPYGFVFVDDFPINIGGKIDELSIRKVSEIDLMKNDVISKKELSLK